MDIAERGYRLFQQIVDRLLHQRIDVDADDLRLAFFERRDGRVARVLLDVGDHHVHAQFGTFPGQPEPDSLAPPVMTAVFLQPCIACSLSV